MSRAAHEASCARAGDAAVALAQSAVVRAQAEEILASDPSSGDGAVRNVIKSNWNVRPNIIAQCPMQFVLVVDLEPTGVVKAVNPEEAPPASEACLSAIEAAIRAVRISSPLPVPPSMTRLRLRYDLAKLSEQMN